MICCTFHFAAPLDFAPAFCHCFLCWLIFQHSNVRVMLPLCGCVQLAQTRTLIPRYPPDSSTKSPQHPRRRSGQWAQRNPRSLGLITPEVQEAPGPAKFHQLESPQDPPGPPSTPDLLILLHQLLQDPQAPFPPETPAPDPCLRALKFPQQILPCF